jgi:DNA-binding transcriptional LysR family regulator
MDTDGIDLNLLRVIQAIDQEGSVTLAAARLGLSQPAVSNALARLRRMLDDPLFVRSSAGMEATPKARRVVMAMDAALGLIRQGLRDGTGFDPASAQEEFSLLMSDLGELVLLPPLMAHLRVWAPHVTVQTRPLSAASYAETLEAGLADLAIGYLPRPRSSLRSRRLFSDDFVCLVRPGHPVLDQPFTLDRYERLAHVAVSRRGRVEGLVTAALATAGIERRLALVLPHFAAAPAVVLASDLAATAPRRLLDAMPGSGLVGLPMPLPMPTIELGLYWHERAQDDAAHRWLRGAFVRLFAPAAASGWQTGTAL